MTKNALIVGAGDGISASFARVLAREGYAVGLAARNTEKLAGLAGDIGAETFACDVVERDDVTRLFDDASGRLGALDVVLYNPSFRTRGPFVEQAVDDVEKALMVTAFGGFLVAQAAAKHMLEAGQGAILFTGASASIKGYALSAPFAMGKFALRGMAQSMARELHPKNIHIAHFVIDGGVRNPARDRVEPDDAPDSFLDPDGIAETYLAILNQPRSVWTWEVEVRPWVERF